MKTSSRQQHTSAAVYLSSAKHRQIEERAAMVAQYIVENNATVRQAAKQFGISKSTVHTVVIKQNGFGGRYSKRKYNILKMPAPLELEIGLAFDCCYSVLSESILLIAFFNFRS